MYQQYRSKVLSLLHDIDADTLKQLSKAMDKAASDFEFSRKETALSVYDGGIPDAVKCYLVTRKIEGLSKNTLILYKLRLFQFFNYVRKPLASITANDIRVFLYDYQEQNDVSNRTLDGIRSAIKAFFSWAAAEKYIDSDPSLNIKKINFERKHREALDNMELEEIRSVCADWREKALIEMLYSTGCRVSEIANAKLSEINWETKELVVLGKGNKHRVVYLNAKAIISLKNYMQDRTDDTDAIFVTKRSPYKPLTVSGIEYVIKGIVSRCEHINKPVSPHIFRHTTATTALRSGAKLQDVQQILGHNQIATTMVYLDIDQSNIKSEHSRCVV